MKKFIISSLYRKLIWVVLILVVGTFSLLPQDQIFIQSPFSDKVEHLVSYFILSTVALLASTQKHSRTLILFGHFVFGIIVEMAQFYILGRYPELLDIGANTLGIILGACAYYIIRKFKPQKNA